MRHGYIAAAAVLLLASRAYCGVDLENGFYPLYRGEPRHTVTSQRGEKLRVGARTEPDIRDVYMWSMDNWNETFRLYVEIPGDVSRSRYVLVVDGTAYKQSSAGSLGTQMVRLGFRIPGREEAELRPARSADATREPRR